MRISPVHELMRLVARAFVALQASALVLSSQAAVKPLAVPSDGKAGFTLLDSGDTGLNFTNRLSDQAAAQNQIRLNGSGVALADVDGDDRVDVFLCGLESDNRLFRNLGGLKFADITGDSPIRCPGSMCTGAVFADVDGDHDMDLLAGAIGEGVRLFLNNGKGEFALSPDSGLLGRGGPTTLTLADADGDGDLDLYVANYRTTTIRTTGFALLNVDGKRVVLPRLREDLEITPDGRVLEHGELDLFYLNDGKGRFQVVPWNGGIFQDAEGRPLTRAPRDWGLCAVFRDINQDGSPDLYVCNDFHSPDRFWLNDGKGKFRPAPAPALRHTSTFSMSVDFADFDRDGWDDFFVTDMLDPKRERRMVQFNATEPVGEEHFTASRGHENRPQYDRNTLFWNRGDGTYAEVAYYAGVEATGWTWSVAAMDVDLDGFEDLLLTTGHMFDTQDLDAAARIDREGPYTREQIPGKLLKYPRLPLPKVALRNLGGMRFVQTGADWGFNDTGIAHGMALGDLDGDGDLDVVVNNLNASVGVYRCDTSSPRVAVRLRGTHGNTQGIGARITLITGELKQSQELVTGGRYLSGDAPGRVFAWPNDATEGRLEVAWRDGRGTAIEGIRPNHLYEIPTPEAEAETIRTLRHPVVTRTRPLFQDVSQFIAHHHAESAFDDFERQPLLPWKLSQMGPGVAWCDLDGDGREELLVGAGAGGRLAAFRLDAQGRLQPVPSHVLDAGLERDTTALIADPFTGRGAIVAFSNHEDGATNKVSLRRLELRGEGSFRELYPDLAGTVTTLAAADLNADGTVELFVGTRSKPGRYPEPASSVILKPQGDRLVIDEAISAMVAPLGRVTSALWTDLEGDGFPELVVAEEWGQLHLLRNRRGQLEPWDAPLVSQHREWNFDRLSAATGLWTTVVSGDLNRDGRMDLIAGNWGSNTPRRASREHPARIYYGDFDESGSLDLFETTFDAGLRREVPVRNLLDLRNAVPRLLVRFPTHADYAKAGIEDVLGDQFAAAARVEARTLTSVVLLNRGDHFEVQPLPDQAQWSPIASAVIADFDGNGDEDVLLAQNFFALPPAESRHDAGLGLLLQNHGAGQLKAMPAIESGIRIHGEQRGCAAADFNHDGRLDLVVGQNGAETRLFRNISGRPGIRVRVQGPAGNPLGLGVSMRLRQGEWSGPRREVRGGSGSLSQDACTIVLAVPMASADSELEITWPGGQTSSQRISGGTMELTIKAP